MDQLACDYRVQGSFSTLAGCLQLLISCCCSNFAKYFLRVVLFPAYAGVIGGGTGLTVGGAAAALKSLGCSRLYHASRSNKVSNKTAPLHQSLLMLFGSQNLQYAVAILKECPFADTSECCANGGLCRCLLCCTGSWLYHSPMASLPWLG